MNYPILAIAVLTLVAFVLHSTGGVWETLKIKPSRLRESKETALADTEKNDRIWTQSLCAFQMLGIDLLVMAGVLYALAATDLILQKREVALVCALIFLLWGFVWVVQMLFIKRSFKSLFTLPHWLIWFACSAMVFYGSTQFA